METLGLMYGKHFASMYTGSMYGKPASVFAVWGYVISHFRPSRKDGQCYVELNPLLLAGTFSTTPEAIMDALAVLESPDRASRSGSEDGRRLVLLSDERLLGPLHYRVVNGPKYREIRDEDDRREYLKEAQRLSRQRRKDTSSTMSTTVNHGQPQSSQAESESGNSQQPSRPSGSKPRASKAKAESPTEAQSIDAILAELKLASGVAFRGKLGRGYILKRLKEGHDEATLLRIAKIKGAQWGKDEKMRSCLNPETLFRWESKFEKYLAEAEAPAERECSGLDADLEDAKRRAGL